MKDVRDTAITAAVSAAREVIAKQMTDAKAAELTEKLMITEMGGDGYAPITGFLNGFAVAQNETRDQTWQIHCPHINNLLWMDM